MGVKPITITDCHGYELLSDSASFPSRVNTSNIPVVQGLLWLLLSPYTYLHLLPSLPVFFVMVLRANFLSCNINFSPAPSLPSDLLLQFHQPKFSMNLSTLACVQNDLPISCSWIYRSNATGEKNKGQLGFSLF